MVLENVDFHIEDSTIVLDPRPNHTGRIAHNLKPIVLALQSINPVAEQCDRVSLLVNGEYVEMQIKNIMQQIS